MVVAHRGFHTIFITLKEPRLSHLTRPFLLYVMPNLRKVRDSEEVNFASLGSELLGRRSKPTARSLVFQKGGQYGEGLLGNQTNVEGAGYRLANLGDYVLFCQL